MIDTTFRKRNKDWILFFNHILLVYFIFLVEMLVIILSSVSTILDRHFSLQAIQVLCSKRWLMIYQRKRFHWRNRIVFVSIVNHFDTWSLFEIISKLTPIMKKNTEEVGILHQMNPNVFLNMFLKAWNRILMMNGNQLNMHSSESIKWFVQF